MAPGMDTVHDRFCRKCYYDLYALEKDRCPECGTEFDPADASTFLRRPPRRWNWARRAVLALLAVAILLGATYGWLYWGWKQEQDALERLGVREVSVYAPIAPAWLYRCMGNTGFVLLRARTVWLRGSYVRDLSALTACAYLRELELDQVEATDLSPVAKLPRLEELYIKRGSVADLTPLSRAPALRCLALRHCRVTDLSPLARVSTLRELGLESDLITQTEVEKFHEAVPDCYINGYWQGMGPGP
jgi:hypothetical protein